MLRFSPGGHIYLGRPIPTVAQKVLSLAIPTSSTAVSNLQPGLIPGQLSVRTSTHSNIGRLKSNLSIP